LEFFEGVGDKAAQAKELMQRAAALRYDEQPESAALDLERAVQLVDAKSDVILASDIYRDLAIVSAIAGNLEKAFAAMVDGERLMRTVEGPRSRCLFEWARGFIEHCSGRYTSAKSRYLVALEGFHELALPFYEAFIRLDLAIASSDLGQIDDAVRFSVEVIPFFDSLKLTSEAIAALLVLKDAIGRRAVTATMLHELRATLWRDPLMSPGSRTHLGRPPGSGGEGACDPGFADSPGATMGRPPGSRAATCSSV
jgi:hypothetical protein